jgi:RNA polymerase sigma-70 factor (ECF subfamily)
MSVYPVKLGKSNIDALVSAAAGGDQKAYETLFNEYFPKISRFVALRVESRVVAEDLTADIFVKVWETLRENQEVASFSNWLYTVARNKIIDHYRTKKSYSDLFELENLLEYEDNIVEAIDLTIASKKFLQVLDRLSPDQQQVIRLKFLEDLDNEEIAVIMDKTPGTIRVIQHRAISELKKILG